VPEVSYREAVRDALAEAMRGDEDVFVMGEDIAEMGGSMGVTQGLVEEFGPERVRNTPISEMAIVGAGIGAAMQGMRPVVEIMYEDFLTISLEQIVNQAAKHRYMSGGQLKVPLTIRTQGGAGWSPGAQHAQQLEAWLVHVPGLKVVFPTSPADARGLLWSAIYDDNPVIFFEHRLLYPVKGEVPDKLEPVPIGKARVVREGTDVTVIATGPLVHRALRAAEDAEKDGISVEIVDPRTLQPLDEDALVESVKKTNRAVVAHEAVRKMGFGAEVAAVLQEKAFDWLDAPVERVGAKFAPLAFAPAMEQYVIPQPADVLEAVKKTLARSTPCGTSFAPSDGGRGHGRRAAVGHVRVWGAGRVNGNRCQAAPARAGHGERHHHQVAEVGGRCRREG
jgi:pyruvate/2-oxoglutarate/acetoin dehydrogenase E1 component